MRLLGALIGRILDVGHTHWTQTHQTHFRSARLNTDHFGNLLRFTSPKVRYPMLSDNLHWLHVWERILFKLCLMVYKALSGFTLSYINELCVPVASIGSRPSLRSAAHGTLFVPRTRLELGKRAFVVAARAAWNSLPDDVRRAPMLDEFKQCLKTHLLIQSYYL